MGQPIVPPQMPTYSTAAMPVITPGSVMGGSGDPSSPYYGMPGYSPFTSVYNPGTMSLAPGLAGDLNNMQGMQAFSSEALRKGQSPWAALALQQQDAQANNQRDQAGAQSAGQTAQAEANIAANGGLSSGARERAAEGGATNALNMDQNIARQSNLNDLQIGVNDEQNRIQELGQLPGMEMQAANMWENARQQDVGNIMSENNSVNNYNMGLYNAQMNAWGANQQAQATANSGKK